MSETIISAVIGGIVAGAGWIWIVINAFRESTSQGLLSLFPLYAIYYGIKRWSDAMQPLVIALVGVVILIIGIVSGLPGMEVGYIDSGAGMEVVENVETVIAEFMEAGAARNVEAAYDYWTPKLATEEEIVEYIESRYDDLFAGYESLDIDSWIGWSTGDTDNCNARGEIIYIGAKILQFEAWLVKENDVWRIIDILIGQPPYFLLRMP